MGNYKRGDKFRGNRGGGRRERPSMHRAVCSDCGKDCEVPFRPTGDKPVFCSDCFGKKEGSGGSRFERRDSRPSFGDKKMFKTTCDKCRKECEVPFRPTGGKPVFCSDCFGKGEKSGRSNAISPDKYEKQFDMLNTKLDNILKILSPNKKEKPVTKAAKPARQSPDGSRRLAGGITEKKKPVKKAVVKKKSVKPARQSPDGSRRLAGGKVAAKKKK
jgi:CxxC-x17-CxxC domain-containing protein